MVINHYFIYNTILIAHLSWHKSFACCPEVGTKQGMEGIWSIELEGWIQRQCHLNKGSYNPAKAFRFPFSPLPLDTVHLFLAHSTCRKGRLGLGCQLSSNCRLSSMLYYKRRYRRAFCLPSFVLSKLAAKWYSATQKPRTFLIITINNNILVLF